MGKSVKEWWKMLKESIRMSWQNIRGNKMRTFLTMLGIIILSLIHI